MTMRAATIVIGLLDALAAAVAVGSHNSGSDPATIGFDKGANGSGLKRLAG